MILNKIGRNSSFTRPDPFIIDSTRSGRSFACCLTSSTYFSKTKQCLFLRVNFLLGVRTPCRQPPPTHFWILQYRNMYILANGKSLYPHLGCRLTRQDCLASQPTCTDKLLSPSSLGCAIPASTCMTGRKLHQHNADWLYLLAQLKAAHVGEPAVRSNRWGNLDTIC